jgi:hypothetical protein
VTEAACKVLVKQRLCGSQGPSLFQDAQLGEEFADT